jgi:hypothetical protein
VNQGVKVVVFLSPPPTLPVNEIVSRRLHVRVMALSTSSIGTVAKVLA